MLRAYRTTKNALELKNATDGQFGHFCLSNETLKMKANLDAGGAATEEADGTSAFA